MRVALYTAGSVAASDTGLTEWRFSYNGMGYLSPMAALFSSYV